MLLGFKRQFAPYVEEGSKTHTIRAHRVIPPRAGEMCHCYVDPRQKTMRLLGRWPCIRVEPIVITVLESRKDFAPVLVISIAGQRLTHDEATEFAWRDGFRPVRKCDALISMGHWWKELRRADFEGDLIHWRFGPGGAA